MAEGGSFNVLLFSISGLRPSQSHPWSWLASCNLNQQAHPQQSDNSVIFLPSGSQITEAFKTNFIALFGPVGGNELSRIWDLGQCTVIKVPTLK